MLRQNHGSMKIAASRSPATRKCMLLIHSKSRSVAFVLMIRGSSFYQLERCVLSEGERLVEERMVVLVQGAEMVIGKTSGFYLGSDAIWGIRDVTEGNQGSQCSYKALQSNVYVSETKQNAHCSVLNQDVLKKETMYELLLQLCQHDEKGNFILTLNLVICLKHHFIFFKLVKIRPLGIQLTDFFFPPWKKLLWLLHVIALWLKFEHALKLDYIVFWGCHVLFVWCLPWRASGADTDPFWPLMEMYSPRFFFSPLFLPISICTALMSEIANLFGCGSE